METAIAWLVATLAAALTQALVKLQQGGTMDDALATAIEHLADKRAKAKFSNFKAHK